MGNVQALYVEQSSTTNHNQTTTICHHLGIGDDESGWLFHVLEYCDMKTRCNCIFVSKRYHSILTTPSSYFWRLQRLHYERGIYFLTQLPRSGGTTWKSQFQDLLPKQYLWLPRQENMLSKDGGRKKTTTTFRIIVSARFKPQKQTNGNDVAGKGNKAVLPLYQRLAFIRMDHDLKTSREALGILKEQGGWFHEEWIKSSAATAEEKNHDGDDTRKDDSNNNVECGITTIDTDLGRVVLVDRIKGLREFQFDHVYTNTCSTQSNIYESSASMLVRDFINGMNGTCLVYGMTGSGKTYTMYGPTMDTFETTNGIPKKKKDDGDHWGIVPRACENVFQALHQRKSNLNLTIDAALSVSYVEIHGNEISDLLENGSLCGNNAASAQQFVLSGAVEKPIGSMDDVMVLLQRGESQKRKAATAMNDRSTRAHSIFILSLRQHCVDTNITIQSKLFLADLGGCEQTKRSNVFAGKSKHMEDLLRDELLHDDVTAGLDMNNGDDDHKMNHLYSVSAQRNIGMSPPRSSLSSPDEQQQQQQQHQQQHSIGFVKSERMKEAVNINLSLMTLKGCVEALHYNSDETSKNRTPRYVPYADSKLTMMLSAGLGGNSQTSVIVCATQEPSDIADTVAALKFGRTCMKVSNPILNNDGDGDGREKDGFLKDTLKRLDEEIKDCEEWIKANERWEVRENRRMDVLAEDRTLESQGCGGVEVQKTTVLLGAEEQRKRLGDLLKRRAQLTGSRMESIVGGIYGFGNADSFGIGERYVSGESEEKENDRFQDEADKDKIPELVKASGVNIGWTDLVENPDELAKRAKTTNRMNLAYSGISA